jgi:hypothetical protein
MEKPKHERGKTSRRGFLGQALTTAGTVIARRGVRGVGEIGITGVCGAIASAIYHAIGKPMGDLPITADKLL